MYSRVILKSQKAGPPEPLPGNLIGLGDIALADLSATLNPVPADLKGIGYWPVDFVEPTADLTKYAVTDEYTMELDMSVRRARAFPRMRKLTVVETQAAYEDANPVPVEIEKLFLLRAVRAAELKAAFDAALAACDDDVREDWAASFVILRADPMLATIAIKMNRDDKAIDELFRKAALLKSQL